MHIYFSLNPIISALYLIDNLFFMTFFFAFFSGYLVQSLLVSLHEIYRQLPVHLALIISQYFCK